MKVTLAQLNPTVGDIEGNLKKIIDTVERYGAGSDIMVFPELFVTGYPPRDLLEREGFILSAVDGLDKVASYSQSFPDLGIIVGLPVYCDEESNKIYNAAAFISNGRVVDIVHKKLLPTYDVFDERRYFVPAGALHPVEFRGRKIAVTICEDMWNDPQLWGGISYSSDPVSDLVFNGCGNDY